MAWTHRLSLLLAALMLTAPPALADDDDDDWFDESDDSDDDDGSERADDADSIDDEEDPDDENWVLPEGSDDGEFDFGDDEFEEDREVGIQGEGEDTARIYRDYLEQMENLGPDEEALSWERYLKKYPNSVFQARIEERLSELELSMYDERIDEDALGSGGIGEAGRAEIGFAQPMLLENIDPRNKIRAGFEWGFPSYINLMADVEYQIFRELSVHGGIRSRYTGWNFEGGARYAIIKSARTEFLLTAIGDIHYNADPGFPGFRPQLAAGKRIRFGGEMYLDAQIQAGVDLASIPGSAGGNVFSPRYVGGANLTLVPNETVRVYLETSSYMKDLGWEEGSSFRFNVVTFGLKFAKKKSKTRDLHETGFGASAPYTYNYWLQHFGSITADVNYYYYTL